MKYLIILVLLVFTQISLANTLTNSVQFNYIGVIEQMLPTWMDLTTKMALKIFTILWCFETFNQLVFKHVLGNDMKQLPTYFITRICFAGFFAFVLLKPDFYFGIIQFFASKTTVISFSGNHINGFDAGWVFEQFKNWSNSVYTPRQDVLGLAQFGKSITYGFMYVIYLVCTCFIALMIIILEVEIYLTIFGALVLTGFAGSSWTFGIWNRYLDAVIGLGIRLLVFGMLFGLFKVLIHVDPGTAGYLNIINSTISIILTTTCLYVIPSKIASMVSGSASGHSLGEAIGVGLGTMATAGYLTNKLDWRNSDGKDTSSKPDNGDTNQNDPLNNDTGSETPVPERMPPDWKPGDN